jgi:uncharacterized protein (DUF952 family)
VIFKILSESQWQAMQASGMFTGSPVDLADGYIHISTDAQVRETVAKHFAGQTDLVLLAIDPVRLPDINRLRWEPSRGGALFPHLYGPLPRAAVVADWPLPWLDGAHRFPAALFHQDS